MARDPSRLRKAYEAKLGKDRVDKLTDQQIGLLSKHYNSLSNSEQSSLDNQIFQGYTTELHEIADSFIEENKPSSDKVSVYTAADKFVDDKKEFAKKQEEKLEDALEETSDKIMDAVDELIAQQKKAFEDFKRQEAEKVKQRIAGYDQYPEAVGPKEPPKQQDEESFRKQVDAKIDDALRESRVNEILENSKKREQEKKQSSQYEKPIGPDPMQGPKQMQGPKEPPKKTVAPEKDEDWESEVPDQLGSKLDDVLEQVRNEPLPQPTKTKRKKTKGKKPVSKRKTGGRKVGLGGTLEEIQENVTETKNALFEMYKIDKKRFEFRKKVDNQLTTLLKAKQSEARLEKEDDEDDEKKKGFFTKVGDEIKNSVKEGLIAGLTMMLIPVITDILRPFFNRNPEEEGENQWWDPLDIIPNPKDMGDEKGEGAVGDEKVQPADTASNPKATETPQVPSTEAAPSAETSKQPSPEAAPSEETFKQPSPEAAPTPTPTPTPTPIPMRDTNIPGDFGYQKPSPSAGGIPFRTAASGGRFSGGEHKPLRPINQSQVNITEIKNKTKPLMSATMLPAKVGTLGLLSMAKNIITPFAALIPEDGRKFIQNVFRETASMAGVDGYNVDLESEESVWDAIKKAIFGDGKDDTPSPQGPGRSGGGGGGGAGAAGDMGNSPGAQTKEQAGLLKALRFAEGTEKSYGTIFGGNVVKQLEQGELTVQEVITMADTGKLPDRLGGGTAPGYGSGSKATGAYQFMPFTLEELIKRGVLKPDEKFTPAVQDKAALSLASARGVSQQMLASEGLSDNVLNKLAPEWASLPTLSGQSYYGQPVKGAEELRGMYSKGEESFKPAPPSASDPSLQPMSPIFNRPDIGQSEGFMEKLMRTVREQSNPISVPAPASQVPTINTKTGTFSSKSSSSRLAASQPSY